MRTNLQGLDGMTITMKAKFDGFYYYQRNGRNYCSALLLNLQNKKGELLADHAWINHTWPFEAANLSDGDIISFSGQINEYVKGYRGHDILQRMNNPIRIDYRITNPCQVRIIRPQ